MAGELLHSPAMTKTTLRHEQALVEALKRAGSPSRLLNAGMEYEFILPIRVGDILAVTGKITDISERQGKIGNMLITTYLRIYINQNSEVAAKSWSTIINC